MKKLTTLLIGFLPVIATAQFTFEPEVIDLEKFSIGLDIGAVFDKDFSIYDIDEWSNDMASGISDPFQLSGRISLNYKVADNFIMGISYNEGNIYGKNTIAFYEGHFSQINASARLDLFQINPDFTIYGKLGAGIVSYTADRTFLNETEPYLNTKGEELNTNQALGMEYDLNDQWSLLLEGRFDRVATDNFDSWDDGSSTDRFFQMSIGARFSILGDDVPLDEAVLAANAITEIPDSLIEGCNKCNDLEKEVEAMKKKIDELEAAKQVQEDKDYVEALGVAKDIRKRLFFAPNSYTIPVTYMPSLEDLASMLIKYPNWKVTIFGYADSDADEEYNQVLSDNRGKAVKELIMSLGVSGDRIETKGLGELAPFESNDTIDGKSLNRRVEINLSK